MQLNQGDEMGAPGGSLLIGFLEDGKACHLYCPCGQEFELRRGIAEAMHAAKRMIVCPACAAAAAGRSAAPSKMSAAIDASKSITRARHDMRAIARTRVIEALEQGIELSEIAGRYDLTLLQVRTALKDIYQPVDRHRPEAALSDVHVEKVIENYLKDPVLRRAFYDGVRLAGRKLFLWAYLHHTLEANLK